MNLSKISDFDPEVDDVDTYILRIKHFLRANRVGEDLKVSTLITILGTKAVSTLIDLFSPDDLDSKTYDEIIEKFKSHYKPAKLTVISGVADQELRQKLISEELTFQQACEQARKFEEAEKQKFSFGQTSAAVPNVNAMNKAKIKKKQVQRSISREVQYSCTRCNSNTHGSGSCRFKSYVCRKCNLRGHLAKACRTRNPKKRVQEIENSDGFEADDYSESFEVSTVREIQTGKKGWFATVNIEGVDLKMQIDTGACVSILPEYLYRSIPELKKKPIIGDKVSLTTYQGEPLDVLGKIKVNVQDQGNMFQLPLVIVRGAKSSAFALIGRNWLEVLKLDWNKIFDINVIAGNRPENDLDIQKLEKKYAKVFSPQIGEIKGKEVNLHLKPNTVPKFCKARPLPYAIKPLVDKELDVLEKAGIIARVPYSEWATPIVVVRKSSNAIRMCADYKVTLNPVLETEHYKLPTTEELFSHLAKGNFFSHLDLASAYQQLKVSSKSQNLLTINTHRGLYVYRRLPFGISTAPSLFQEVMDQILEGIPGVTDHKPLTAIFGEKRGIPPIAAARMQRWAIILSAYQYEIQFVKGNSISHADALSRIPLPETVEEVSCFSMCDEFNHFICFFSAVESAPLTAKEIAVATQEDPVLRQVLHFTLNGWPEVSCKNPELKPYELFQVGRSIFDEQNYRGTYDHQAKNFIFKLRITGTGCFR
ncbi:hypothetical protein JTE90_015793 [Oedothorax gibbosus]|uniref:CCHC-type domain-containing protein n=1 Tax=Oedothorax gibbosus TaxID=931172 RepID=A0AAV6U102_9ARAC|nr:hypothetical protein JTE90_015793 [Oedothorax gibbosus]